MRKNAGWALTLGSLMAAAISFYVFVAAAGALRVPLKKVLPYVAQDAWFASPPKGRSRHSLRPLDSLSRQLPGPEMTMIAMIVIAIAGSAFSIVSWVRR